jgi:hypothetical protein
MDRPIEGESRLHELNGRVFEDLTARTRTARSMTTVSLVGYDNPARNPSCYLMARLIPQGLAPDPTRTELLYVSFPQFSSRGQARTRSGNARSAKPRPFQVSARNKSLIPTN